MDCGAQYGKSTLNRGGSHRALQGSNLQVPEHHRSRIFSNQHPRQAGLHLCSRPTQALGNRRPAVSPTKTHATRNPTRRNRAFRPKSSLRAASLPANSTPLRALYAWCLALGADRADAPARQGTALSYQAPAFFPLLQHSGHYFWAVLLSHPLSEPACNGYDFRSCSRKRKQSARGGAQPAPRSPPGKCHLRTSPFARDH
jgi:hypothetical protein